MADPKIHPAAQMFPIDEEGIEDLAKGIKECGQLIPIDLLDGKIIDGRRRFKACKLAGIEPEYQDVELDDLDPYMYSYQLNDQRRHLTASQRAMAASIVREKATDSHGPTSNKEAADQFKVSERMVNLATKVRKKGAKELGDAVMNEKVSLAAAAKIADMPVSKQKKEVAKKQGQPKQKAKSESELIDSIESQFNALKRAIDRLASERGGQGRRHKAVIESLEVFGRKWALYSEGGQ